MRNYLIDTHCHIHEADYKIPSVKVIGNAKRANVNKMICVGTDETTSNEAVAYVQNKSNLWASIGLHPHDAKMGQDAFDGVAMLLPNEKIVAVGECGLDYYYNHSAKQDQFKALEFQMQLAQDNNLPMIFHIRDAFDDFWPIFDNFSGIKGVIHSFTATSKELNELFGRGLYVGLNGIMTFTKDEKQLEAAKNVPLNRLLLETDSPFLTPQPLRGTINEPKNIKLIATFLAQLRGESLQSLSTVTTKNAEKLFGI